MNIFAVHINPSVCVRALDDKRVNKMILESLQMLSTAVHMSKSPLRSSAMRPSYHNHPCTVWTRTSRANYNWLLQYTQLLIEEANFRDFSTASYHKYVEPLVLSQEYISDGPLTPFADCTEFKTRKDLDVTERYQLFMCLKWFTRDQSPRWTNRKPPWFVNWGYEELQR